MWHSIRVKAEHFGENSCNFGKTNLIILGTLPPSPGGYEGEHHTPSVICFRAYSSTNYRSYVIRSAGEMGPPDSDKVSFPTLFSKMQDKFMDVRLIYMHHACF